MDGFLNLDKPLGFTSHDCVARVRRLLRQKRVGHAGTLDPAATGVLPIAMGRATRLLQFLPSDKAYRAVIRFGVQTATDDLEGDVLQSTPCLDLTLETIQSKLPQFLGTIQQVPPQYSAIQVGGQRLYDKARKGEVVEVPVRTVEVQSIEVLGWHLGEFPELEVAIACGPGTYIRAIARDLGQAVNTGATLAKLIRTHSSGFDLDNSLSLTDLEEQLQQQRFQPITPEVALQALPMIHLPDSEARRWCMGQRLLWEGAETPGEQAFRVYGEESDRLLGIGQIRTYELDAILSPWVVLSQD